MLRAIQDDSRLAGHYPDKRIHKHQQVSQPQAEDRGTNPEVPSQNHNNSQQIESPLQGDRGTNPEVPSQNHNNSQQPNASELVVTNEKTLISQQNEETPLLFLGGDIGRKAEGFDLPIGEVDSQNHNKTQQPNASELVVTNEKTLISQQNEETTDKKPLRPGVSAVKTTHKPLNTISHAGLRKLFAKNRQEARKTKQ